jgi:hypothetical protein
MSTENEQIEAGTVYGRIASDIGDATGADAVLVVVCGGAVGTACGYVVMAEAFERWRKFGPTLLRKIADDIENNSEGNHIVGTMRAGVLTKPGST